MLFNPNLFLFTPVVRFKLTILFVVVFKTLIFLRLYFIVERMDTFC